MNVETIASAVADVDRPVERDDAAEGGQAVGVAGAHVRVGGGRPIAAPHGLVCLITTAAGSSNSSTMRDAASRSSRFVYDSSLPCRIVGRAKPEPRPSRSGRRDVPRRVLVRVLAVAQVADLLERQRRAI